MSSDLFTLASESRACIYKVERKYAAVSSIQYARTHRGARTRVTKLSDVKGKVVDFEDFFPYLALKISRAIDVAQRASSMIDARLSRARAVAMHTRARE